MQPYTQTVFPTNNNPPLPFMCRHHIGPNNGIDDTVLSTMGRPVAIDPLGYSALPLDSGPVAITSPCNYASASNSDPVFCMGHPTFLTRRLLKTFLIRVSHDINWNA